MCLTVCISKSLAPEYADTEMFTWVQLYSSLWIHYRDVTWGTASYSLLFTTHLQLLMLLHLS